MVYIEVPVQHMVVNDSDGKDYNSDDQQCGLYDDDNIELIWKLTS